MRGHKNFLCFGKGMTDYPYPIIGSSGSGLTSLPNLAPVTADVGVTPTTLGRGMSPNAVVPELPNLAFRARGLGVFDLDEPNVPPTDVRFTRGPRLNGVRGTIDIWFQTPVAGTARTLAYLTDDPVGAVNVMAVRADTSNRPKATLIEQDGATAATGVLTGTSNFGNGETVVIDGKTYTFQLILTESDGNVFIGAGLAASLANLKAAINLEAGGGSLYANATTLHPTVSATASDATTLSVEAKAAGPGGNLITTTETAGNASWGGATLSGGAVGGSLVGEVTPSYAAIPEGKLTHVRFTWDSVNPVSGSRHATLTVDGEAIPDGDWATDPTSGWLHFKPTHLVLGQGYGGDSGALPGTIVLVQASNVVQP